MTGVFTVLNCNGAGTSVNSCQTYSSTSQIKKGVEGGGVLIESLFLIEPFIPQLSKTVKFACRQ